MFDPNGKQENWRELCAAAASEPDSEKLASLVHQILAAFDEKDNCRERADDAAAFSQASWL